MTRFGFASTSFHYSATVAIGGAGIGLIQKFHHLTFHSLDCKSLYHQFMHPTGLTCSTICQGSLVTCLPGSVVGICSVSSCETVRSMQLHLELTTFSNGPWHHRCYFSLLWWV